MQSNQIVIQGRLVAAPSEPVMQKSGIFKTVLQVAVSRPGLVNKECRIDRFVVEAHGPESIKASSLKARQLVTVSGFMMCEHDRWVLRAQELTASGYEPKS